MLNNNLIFDGPLGIARKILKSDITKEQSQNCVVMVNPDLVYQDRLSIATNENSLNDLDNNIYFMASIGKILTAKTTIEYLQKNKYNLETKISELLENYPRGKSNFIDKIRSQKHFNEIKVIDLLRHTSGIGQFEEESFKILTDKTNEMLSSESILNLKIKNGVYGNFDYSNPGYELVVLILEHHSKQKYEDLARELVLKPSNLVDEIFLRDQIIKQDNGNYTIKGYSNIAIVTGKNFDGTNIYNLINLPFRGGASIYANPKAVSKLASIIWDYENLKNLEKYEVEISKGSKYGAGYIKDSDGIIRHDGGMDGTRGTVIYDPLIKKSTCVIATLENKNPPIATKILQQNNEYKIFTELKKHDNHNTDDLEKKLEIKRKEIIDDLRSKSKTEIIETTYNNKTNSDFGQRKS